MKQCKAELNTVIFILPHINLTNWTLAQFICQWMEEFCTCNGSGSSYINNTKKTAQVYCVNFHTQIHASSCTNLHEHEVGCLQCKKSAQEKRLAQNSYSYSYN